MADDQFQLGSGSWWDPTRNRLFDTGTPPTSTPTTLNNLATFQSWPTEMAPGMNKPTSITASGGVSGHEQSSGDGGLADQNFQMMGLGLSSPNLDWNQALFTGEKVESSFRSMLHEDFHHKLYSGLSSSEDSSANEFKQVNRPQTGPFSCPASSNDDSAITSGQNLTAGFQLDFHDMLLSKNNQHQHQQQQQQQQQPTYQHRSSVMNYPNYPSTGGGHGANASEFRTSARKYPQQFVEASLPLPTAAASGIQLHFTNNTPLWNASVPSSTMQDDARSSFFPAGLQTHQIPTPPSFEDKTKKNNIEITSNKRSRGSESDSPLPPFKVRKEKMGDRITALQQLVSPFGKTDTASVLSEAIAYIHFLHEQVSVLSNPYLKNGAPIQHHQNSNKSNDSEWLPHQDLRNRGLCLVPASSTFPMTHETTVDFWTPTFGGTFR
ncbi:hypothetical protein OROGR_007282 [Orobanche gracilis]